jgi:hypothetical protein
VRLPDSDRHFRLIVVRRPVWDGAVFEAIGGDEHGRAIG